MSSVIFKLLDQLGLLPALRFLAEGVSERSGIVVRVHGELESRPPAPVENAVYRVVQEALTNCARHAHASEISVNVKGGKDDICVTVQDNGVGFDMKYHDRIFGLFNRLVRATEYEGTGAGLAIVAKVVDKLGGQVRAASAPGEGATFFVHVPQLAAEAGAAS